MWDLVWNNRDLFVRLPLVPVDGVVTVRHVLNMLGLNNICSF